MLPPICVFCGKDFRDDVSGGQRISFKLTDEDRAFNQRMKDKKMVGPTKGTAWFCSEHAPVALQFSNYTKSEALEMMRDTTSQ